MNAALGRAARVGILGSGQLARMLGEAAKSLGLQTVILADKKSDCAIPVADEVVFKADSDAFEKLNQVDVLTIENEFVDLEWLKNGIKKTMLFPTVECLSRIQDKLQQKKSLAGRGLPALDFVEIAEPSDFKKALSKFGASLVLKKAKFGYDGRGTYIFTPEKPFNATSLGQDFRGYAEPLARFKKELAVIVARSRSGEVATYPVVETNQEGGICRWAVAPAEIDKKVAQDALDLARGVIEGFEGVGVFGVEMFWLEDGRVVVNEIAPRVHNSGHLTMDACDVGQFEMHWRAVLDLPLGAPKLLWPGAAMVNVLGRIPGEQITDPAGPAVKINEAQTWFHWYGKTGPAFGRKLGHVNAAGTSAANALIKATEIRERIK